MQNIADRFFTDFSGLNKTEINNLLMGYAVKYILENNQVIHAIENAVGRLIIANYNDYAKKATHIYEMPNIIVYNNIKNDLMEMANQRVKDKEAEAQYKRGLAYGKQEMESMMDNDPEPKKSRLKKTPSFMAGMDAAKLRV